MKTKMLTIIFLLCAFRLFALSPTEKKLINTVKNGSMFSYPEVKLEAFFKYLFNEPLWECEYLDGSPMVGVSGNMNLNKFIPGTTNRYYITFIFYITGSKFYLIGAVDEHYQQYDEEDAVEFLNSLLYYYEHTR